LSSIIQTLSERALDLPEREDYEVLLCAGTPLLDVRAPVEFAQGAFPASVNLPLLEDDERHQIGIRYKDEGHEAAVALGAQLISGEVRLSRVEQWAAFIEQHPDTVLYCFRGGMRSKIAQQWIYEQTGKVIPRVKGGYKVLRRFLIDQTEGLSAQTEPLILSGRTGSGKTLLLKELSNMIDLEGLANHRGSSIGRQLSPQPTQIEFENRVAIALLKLHRQGVCQIVLEDESPNIGSVHIPHALYDKMLEASCVVLEATIEQRIDITLTEYVSNMLPRYVEQQGDVAAGFDALSEYLRNSLSRVQRRLGRERYAEILETMDLALDEQAQSGDEQGHRQWLQRMLVEYYDPMYDYQRDKRQRMVKKTGNFAEILDYLHDFH